MHTILGYLWQYITNPKAIIALSLFVALMSSYTSIPRHIFWALASAYALGLIAYGIYWLIQRKSMLSKVKNLRKRLKRIPKQSTAKIKIKKSYNLLANK